MYSKAVRDVSYSRNRAQEYSCTLLATDQCHFCLSGEGILKKCINSLKPLKYGKKKYSRCKEQLGFNEERQHP